MRTYLKEINFYGPLLLSIISIILCIATIHNMNQIEEKLAKPHIPETVSVEMGQTQWINGTAYREFYMEDVPVDENGNVDIESLEFDENKVTSFRTTIEGEEVRGSIEMSPYRK